MLWPELWHRDPHTPTEKQNPKLSLSWMWNLNLFYSCGEGTPSCDINIKTGAGPQWKIPRAPSSGKPQTALEGCFFNNGHMSSTRKIHNKNDKLTQDVQLKMTKHEIRLQSTKNPIMISNFKNIVTEKYFCKIIIFRIIVKIKGN